MKLLRLGEIALTIGISSLSSFGQNTPAGINKQSLKLSGGDPVPRRVLYHQFFRHLLYLDNQSKRIAAIGSREDALRLGSYYQSQLHFNGAQMASLRAIAQATESQVAAVDDQAKAVITKFRSQYPQGRLSSRESVPAAPAELAQLQQKRDSLIESEMAALNSQLGPRPAALLNFYLRIKFAPHVTVAHVDPSRPHDPLAHPAPPFQEISASEVK